MPKYSLGNGTYDDVYGYKDPITNKMYAVKVFKVDANPSDI